jgi:hypothetical protein
MFDSMKTQSTKKTSVWIGDLYHNPTGGSRGKWFELSDETTVESLQREVNAMLAEANDSFPHTRYFIGKSKNIPIFSAHQNLESLLQVASLVRIHGNDIVKGFMDWVGIDAVFSFEDAFLGVYDSQQAYAREFIHKYYDLDKMLGALASYFDYVAFARDVLCVDVFCVDITTADGAAVAIFNSRF